MCRDLFDLKSYVRNRAHPEGSIAESYIANECLTCCSQYLEGGNYRYYWSRKNTSNIEHEIGRETCLFPCIGQPYGKIEAFMMDEKIWLQAHRYVIFNCDSDVIESFKK